MMSSAGVPPLDSEEGTLSVGKDSILSLNFKQQWALDATGNWSGFKEDDDGDSTWDLEQTRTSSAVNEITDVAETTGPSWITPAYNRAGNMTTIPQPGDPTQSYAATYDAWNRLVKLEEGQDTAAEYVFDGAGRRVVRKKYASGSLSQTRHFYYTGGSDMTMHDDGHRADSPKVGAAPSSPPSSRRVLLWDGSFYATSMLQETFPLVASHSASHEKLESRVPITGSAFVAGLMQRALFGAAFMVVAGTAGVLIGCLVVDGYSASLITAIESQHILFRLLDLAVFGAAMGTLWTVLSTCYGNPVHSISEGNVYHHGNASMCAELSQCEWFVAETRREGSSTIRFIPGRALVLECPYPLRWWRSYRFKVVIREPAEIELWTQFLTLARVPRKTQFAILADEEPGLGS